MKLYNSFIKGNSRNIPVCGGYSSLEEIIAKSVMRLQKIKKGKILLTIVEYEEITDDKDWGINYTPSKVTLELLIDLTNKGKVLD